MNNILNHINSHEELKKLGYADLPQLCIDVREFIIDTILENGGHFAANLGVVELTVALHHQLHLPIDTLIWDVGHQAYAHKVLTGRKERLNTIRKKGGLAGFPSIFESEYDAFGTGHSSTSLSALAGIAKANELNNKDFKHVAVIGDGALTAGQAFEALNHIAELDINVLVIINDNQMSIDANNGNFGKILAHPEKAREYFKTLGFKYGLCLEGNNFNSIYDSVKDSLAANGPRILHIKTKKGFGFDAAEADNIRWHATESTVKVLPNMSRQMEFLKFQEVAGKTLVRLAKTDEKIIAVTPAMPTGSGLKDFEKEYPNRFFDVGIAEQHAVTFSAGMAKQGYKVFCFIYSTFLQRAYDQLIHDVCLQNLPVVFCIDRAGLVGGDGATHHGAFDMAFLQPIPNLVIKTPGTINELQNAMYAACINTDGPIAIRYPRGRGNEALTEVSIEEDFKLVIENDSSIGIITIGAVYGEVKEALQEYDEKVSWLHLRQIKPLPRQDVLSFLEKHSKIITIEDGVVKNGVGQQIASMNIGRLIDFKHLGVSDYFVEHGLTRELRAVEGFNSVGILRALNQF